MKDHDIPTPLPTSVTLADMQARIAKVTYTILPDTTTTVCQLHMVNGYVVLGTSACVDPKQFSQATGEKYAYEDAINECWTLEGYLLAERRYQATLNK